MSAQQGVKGSPGGSDRHAFSFGVVARFCRSADSAMAAAIAGIALTVGAALIGWMIQSTVPLDQLGAVVLGGLIAFGACRRN
jgi:hypothetical protein